MRAGPIRVPVALMVAFAIVLRPPSSRGPAAGHVALSRPHATGSLARTAPRSPPGRSPFARADRPVGVPAVHGRAAGRSPGAARSSAARRPSGRRRCSSSRPSCWRATCTPTSRCRGSVDGARPSISSSASSGSGPAPRAGRGRFDRRRTGCRRRSAWSSSCGRHRSPGLHPHHDHAPPIELVRGGAARPRATIRTGCTP